MITVKIKVLGVKLAEVVLEGSDDIEDEFAALLEDEATVEES